MHRKSSVLFSFALALTQMACAQTKVSGTLQCDKADPTYTIPVANQPWTRVLDTQREVHLDQDGDRRIADQGS